MIVVSDTSPLGSLFLIGRLSLLPALFGKVVIPGKVFDELMVLETSFGHDLSEFKSASWLEVVQVVDIKAVHHFQKILDKGESEAIVLAKELRADFLLMDETDGRRIAQQEGLRIIGLIGVLMRAKRTGIIEAVKPLLDELRLAADFRIAQSLYEQVLKEMKESS